MEREWKQFFMCQPNPVLRSQLLAALMAGQVLQVERLPVAVLQDAVLLAMAARNYCEAEVVDDYAALLQRTRDEWRRPDFTHALMDQTHGYWVDAIVERGASSFDNYEEQYIPEMTAWFLAHDAPSYFSPSGPAVPPLSAVKPLAQGKVGRGKTRGTQSRRSPRAGATRKGGKR